MHEIAHYVMSVIIPSAEVRSVKLSRYDDSYVDYRISAPRVYKLVIIAFAPFYVNTAISLYCAYTLTRLDMTSISHLLLVPILYYISVVMAAKSLPSSKDLHTPIEFMKKNLFSSRIIVIALVAPAYILISLPLLLLANLRMRSVALYYIVQISYAIAVFVFGVILGFEHNRSLLGV